MDEPASPLGRGDLAHAFIAGHRFHTGSDGTDLDTFNEVARNLVLEQRSVEYDGPEPGEEYVERIEEENASIEQTVDDIIIDMNDDLNVKEVRRA